MTTVWIYVDTSHEFDHINDVKVFASKAAAQAWFDKNDPQGVAFEYEVMESAERLDILRTPRGLKTRPLLCPSLTQRGPLVWLRPFRRG